MSVGAETYYEQNRSRLCILLKPVSVDVRKSLSQYLLNWNSQYLLST
jgi:hypothetical protein